MTNTKELPVWAASLMALPLVVVDDAGARIANVSFQANSLRYTATSTAEVLQPFGLTLAKGDIVAIQWRGRGIGPVITIKKAAIKPKSRLQLPAA